MKKLMLFLALSILLFSFVSAGFECSDDTQPEIDRDELSTGDAKSIGGVKIGLTKADEVSAFQRISAEILIDAESIELPNNTVSQDLELFDETFNFSIGGISGSEVSIFVDGDENPMEEGDYEETAGIIIFLHELTVTDTTISADIVAGQEKIILSNKDSISETFTFDDKTYGATLIVASDDSATIQVSECITGDLTLITSPAENNTTKNETEQNETEQNETTETNETEQQPSHGIEASNDEKEVGELCNNDDECLSNYCRQNLCANLDPITRFFNWLRGLFGN